MRLQQGKWDACASTSADAFVLTKGPTKVTIGSPDRVEVTLDTLNEYSPQPHTVPIPPASPVVTSRQTARIEGEDSTCCNKEATCCNEEETCWREEATYWHEEATYWHEEATYWHEESTCLREEVSRLREEALRREQERNENEAQCEKKVEESGSKLISEGCFALSPGPRSTSVGDTTLQFNCSPMMCTPSQGGPGHTMGSNKRSDSSTTPLSQQSQGSAAHGSSNVAPLEMSANRWVPTSSIRKAQLDVDTPEVVVRKVKALLNKLTMERFDSISEQIMQWVNKSLNEKDGRMLIQVVRLVFENATDEAAWSEIYARLCRKMLEQISLEMQAAGIKSLEGKLITGGLLFRKYVLSRCQENFERMWFSKEATTTAAAAKASDGQATKNANEKMSTEEAQLYSDEFYAAQKARRQGLGLMTFIGELFKLQMLTERIMHECVKKLLGNVENPKEEVIESLCQLLKLVGQLLDTPKARAYMDVYFTRMKELGKSTNVSSRMQFVLQDVIELRERKWVSRNAVTAPTTIAGVHGANSAITEKDFYNRWASMSCGGTTTSNATTSTASTPKPTIKKADIAKLFQNPSSSLLQPSSDTSSPSTRPHNPPPHHQPSSSTPQPLPQPSQLGAHPYAQFVPGIRQTQQGTGVPWSPAFTRVVANMPDQSRPGGWQGGPGGPPILASPRIISHPHQVPPTGVASQVPMQPMQWSGYHYSMDPYNQSQHPYPGPPLPMSLRPAAPQLPGTPNSTMAHTMPPHHTHQSPPSVSSAPPTPSTTNAAHLNANASAFVPGGRPSTKVTIKSKDGMEVTLDALKKHRPKPLTVPIPRTTSIRIKSEKVRRLREEALRKEQERKKKKKVKREKKDEEEQTCKEEEEWECIWKEEEGRLERLRREEEERLEVQQKAAKRDVSTPPPSALPTLRVIENLSEVVYPEGIKSMEKPPISHLLSTESKLTIQERLPPSPGGNGNKRTRTKRGNSNKALLSQQGQDFAFGSSIPTDVSEADAEKKIDEDVKDLFAVRNLEEADMYFADLPHEHRFRLVDKLVASALERNEADARLVGEFFARAESNGLCTLAVFEEGFMSMAEFLDDIAIDAPMALDNMAIMLRGAGFEKEPERLERIASKLKHGDE